jgi:hypothetical protein
MDTIPAVGTLVHFREGTPQFAKCGDSVYVVEAAPSGEPFSVDEHGTPYVWLVVAADSAKVPSQRRRRSGWVAALQSVTITEGDAMTVSQIAATEIREGDRILINGSRILVHDVHVNQRDESVMVFGATGNVYLRGTVTVIRFN